MRRVLFIENHDSFSWNVIDALPFPREAVGVVRAGDAGARLHEVDAVVMGPGPTDPQRAGLVALVQEIARRGLPFLGVCLGHQALGLAFGATLIRSQPAHGKRGQATFSGSRFFADGALEVMRYHSLSLRDVAAPRSVVASLHDGTVMAVEHATLPMAGVQFHPDSFGTPHGRGLLASFFQRSGRCELVEDGRPAEPPERPVGRSSTGSDRPETVSISSLRDRSAFALLAPGFTDSEHWTLFEPGEGPSSLLFISAESRIPIRLTGTARAVTPHFDVPASAPTVVLDETGFLSGVRAIRERIAAGDVYQVNLTLRAKLTDVDGAQLLTTLCARAVPRFAAWVRTPELGEFVSASPELLCEQRDRVVRVEPMKGTAPPDQRAWLEASEKDR
ncbi:MAG TPA: chorismate-binding protein, partial [Archangium sp.]